MPAAARVTDLHTCSDLVDRGPHADADVITQGAADVLIEGRNAARMGDALEHGGRVLTGCPSVLIGDSAQTATLRDAASAGVPFCEECERARARRAVLAGPVSTGAESVLIGNHPAARVGDHARCVAHGGELPAPPKAHEG